MINFNTINLKIKSITYLAVFFLFTSLLPSIAFCQKKENKLLSVLWKVQYPNSSKISYILGSNHYFKNTWSKSFPKIDSIIISQETFICENLAAIDTSKKINPYLELFKTRMTAKELFGEDYDLVNNYFLKKTGSGISQHIDNAEKPLAVAYRMFYFLFDEIAQKNNLKISNEDGLSMDDQILLNAFAKKKDLIALDNINSIYKIMASDVFIKTMSSGISGIIKAENEISQNQVKSYKNLIEFLVQYNEGKYLYNFKKDDGIGEKVGESVTRNKIWMKTLPNLIKKKNSFIVVGIKHLDGKAGLIKLLKKQGFIISPEELK